MVLSYPLKYDKQFTVNTTALGNQSASKICLLPNGSFVVTWIDESQTGGDTSGKAIRAQVFYGDGTVASPELLVNTGTNKDQTDPVVTGLYDNSFVIAWTDFNGVGDANPTVQVQAFLYDGTKQYDQVGIAFGADYPQYQPSIALLEDGGFALAYTALRYLSGPDTSGTSIEVVLVEEDGLASEPIAVNTLVGFNQYVPEVTGLSGGNFVVTWGDDSDTEPDTSINAVYAQVFSPTGAKIGNQFMANFSTASRQESPVVTALADGGFVIAWEDFSQTGTDQSSNAIRAQVFSGNGVPIGPELQLNTTTDQGQRGVSIASLRDGRFVAVWVDGSNTGGDTSISAIRGQVFNPDGSKEGGEFLVNTQTNGIQLEPSVSGLADGRFVVSWTDLSPTGADTTGWAIEAQMFDARTKGVKVVGGVLVDSFVGSRFNDKLIGLDSDDLLAGEGRKDRLFGGRGDDIMVGGKGNDVLIGGAGADKLAGGGGFDRILSGAGADTLVGGTGQDEFIYRSAKDANRDKIADFDGQKDFLNFSLFMPGGRFIGTDRFSGDGPEVRYDTRSRELRGDVDGDGHADWWLTFGKDSILAPDSLIF